MMIGLFYQFHPLAVAHPLRSRLAMGLLWIWAVRMTHSYFRRCGWADCVSALPAHLPVPIL